MKILFCSQTHLSKELGAAKVLIELAEELEQVGWRCTLLSRSDVSPSLNGRSNYPENLRRYLIAHAREYDVVDYDHHHLPFPRHEFPEQTLFVARSVLLWDHFRNISLPQENSFKERVRSLVFGMKEAKRRERVDRLARVTVSEADLINVANYDDQAALLRIGIPQEKIAVIPYGISRASRDSFDTVSSAVPSAPKIAFVGTFDNRKGSTDFPEIVEAVCRAVPGASFRLLGTGRDERTVLASFPARLRKLIEVVPRYAPADLPTLLAPCSVGVFPSYIEGFGLGVVEMLAASIPVISYNSPGPPMMLPPEYLVERGNTKAMSERVIELLTDKRRLAAARVWSKRQAQPFSWRVIAQQTSDLYLEHIRRKYLETL